MLLGATFLDLLWSLIIIFFMVAFFFILFQVLVDIFRRDDASGGKKTLWVLFVIFLPFLGVLVYLIANNEGMTARNVREVRQSEQQFESYVKDVAGGGGPADQIGKAKDLLDQGAITQEEFDSIKTKALAT
jgi:predicted PurR-regulated permease PerM